MLAAREEAQATAFLFLHGQQMFKLLAVGSPAGKLTRYRWRSESLGMRGEMVPGELRRRNTRESHLLEWDGVVDAEGVAQLAAEEGVNDGTGCEHKEITFDEFARFGFALGLSAEYMSMRLSNEFYLNIFDAHFDYDLFMMCYFDILSQLDNLQKKVGSGSYLSLNENEHEDSKCVIV